jgi:hypothetical protein
MTRNEAVIDGFLWEDRKPLDEWAKKLNERRGQSAR